MSVSHLMEWNPAAGWDPSPGQALDPRVLVPDEEASVWSLHPQVHPVVKDLFAGWIQSTSQSNRHGGHQEVCNGSHSYAQLHQRLPVFVGFLPSFFRPSCLVTAHCQTWALFEVFVKSQCKALGWILFWKQIFKMLSFKANGRIDFPAPSLRMCGESIEMAVQYKDGATLWLCYKIVLSFL